MSGRTSSRKIPRTSSKCRILRTQIRSQTDASFNADNNGGEIRVSRGGVETTVGGAKTTISENEFAALNNGKVASKETLLPPPRAVSPANMAQLVDTSGSGAGVAFAWQDNGGDAVSGFYLQVSRSSYFASDGILVDRNGLTTRDFRLAGLSPGTYYWRLKATAKSGQISDWSEPWKFGVVRRETSKTIDAAGWQVEAVGGNVYIISGKTQPGLQVKSQGNQVFAGSDGTFRLQISTPLSEVGVEFNDDRGNRAGYVLSVRTSKVLRRF